MWIRNAILVASKIVYKNFRFSFVIINIFLFLSFSKNLRFTKLRLNARNKSISTSAYSFAAFVCTKPQFDLTIDEKLCIEKPIHARDTGMNWFWCDRYRNVLPDTRARQLLSRTSKSPDGAYTSWKWNRAFHSACPPPLNGWTTTMLNDYTWKHNNYTEPEVHLTTTFNCFN